MWHSDSCQRACDKHSFCHWELAGPRCFSVTLAATASWLPGLGRTVGGLGEACVPMSLCPMQLRSCWPTASYRLSTSGFVTDQGSWPEPINRNWPEARQEIQARLYWRLCCSTGEQEKNNRFACLLPAPWVGLAPNIGPVVCAGVRLEAWLAHAFRWYVVPCFCSWFFRPGSCIFVSFVQKLL